MIGADRPEAQIAAVNALLGKRDEWSFGDQCWYMERRYGYDLKGKVFL